MTNPAKPSFHTELKQVMDYFVHTVYDVTANFPSDEQFGLTSQLRRASLSVVLNYIEGYARQRKLVLKNFVEIAYGSLQESKYLLGFSHKRGYIDSAKWHNFQETTEKIGGMLWGILKRL